MLVVVQFDPWRTFCHNEDLLKVVIPADGPTCAKSRGKNLVLWSLLVFTAHDSTQMGKLWAKWQSLTFLSPPTLSELHLSFFQSPGPTTLLPIMVS